MKKTNLLEWLKELCKTFRYHYNLIDSWLIPYRFVRFSCDLIVLAISPFFQVRYIPEWFPGAKFQRIAASARKDLFQFLNEPFLASVRRVVGVLPGYLGIESEKYL